MPACSQARMAWQHAGLRSSAPDFGRQPDLLITIPGIGPRVALVIISESGPETAEYFLTEAHLASWAGLCPVTTNRPANASMAGPHGSRLFPERGWPLIPWRPARAIGRAQGLRKGPKTLVWRAPRRVY